MKTILQSGQFTTTLQIPAVYSAIKQEFIYHALRIVFSPQSDPKLVTVCTNALKTYRRI